MDEDKKPTEETYSPNYSFRIVAIVIAILMIMFAWWLVMDVEEYNVTGTIDEVILKDNGFADDTVLLVFKENSSIEFDFDSKSFYSHKNNVSDADLYSMLKSYIGKEVRIVYTKSPIGDIGFVSIEEINLGDR